MAAAYISETEIAAQITQAKFDGLFSDDSGDIFRDQLIEQASERVRSAAKRAGHALGDTTTDQNVVYATMGVFLLLAYGRRDEQLPERFSDMLRTVDKIERGEIALDGAPNTTSAIGGAVFSESNEDTSSTARFNPLSREKMAGY